MMNQEILSFWKDLLDRFEEGSLPMGTRYGKLPEVTVERELLRLGAMLHEALPEDDKCWEDPDPLLKLFADTMWFIEHHLMTTEYWGDPRVLASGEKLESGMFILSVLHEIASDLAAEELRAED